ncbi:MAG: PIN domain-containing protein [Planctomycetota bacterium]|nr:MAG: PIN domain-containing protein [Planctomycetota bacterium]REJ93908.1 MAG: PIN domain-containing protein [Planctomycetota bacterium]REK20686.1 MAG: PIN domain-containing protein [Planctomycetota bacterium]REK38132.1 MAG: PIN domain-containing protein [Planctomycetota bacterium]
MRIVLDTSVLVAAARSRRGASFALLSLIPSSAFQICLSVPLYVEWQDVLTRPQHLPPGRSPDEALAFLRFLAAEAHLQEVYYLWRPFLCDPDDDMVLELAVAAGCIYVVTHNPDDFQGSPQFGVEAVLPGDFLRLIIKS